MEQSSFCTDLRGAGRRDSFEAALNSRFSLRFRIQPTADRFRASMTTFSAASLGCADIRFSAHTTSLLPGLTRSSQVRTILASYQDAGSVILRQDGRQSRIEAGEFFLIDTGRPFFIETSDVHTRSVYLAESAFRDAFPEVSLCTGVGISGTAGSGRLVKSLLDDLFVLAADMDDADAERMAALLPHALSLAFSPYLRSLKGRRSDIEDQHRARIKAYARANLGDPDLDCACIAAAAGLSQRTVHELFADQDQTLMRWVWSERLARIHRDLANPSLDGQSISTTIFNWGFSDPAHFSRVFKAAYGISARQHRKTAASTCSRRASNAIS